MPRDFWLEASEKAAILDFQEAYPLEGYRRLTFTMLDRDLIAVSPSSVYRVLRAAGRLSRWAPKSSARARGSSNRPGPTKHWHCDISYLNICGTFYYLCSVLDGFSRAIVHWEIREAMTEADVEIVVQRARERSPGHKTRLISDNGPQFIARDFKTYIRETGLEHVRTSIGPHSKLKKAECIRPGTPLSVEDARRIVGHFVEYYNEVRLHAATGYIAHHDMLAGRAEEIRAERDRKLEEAGERRRQRRNQATA